MLLTIDMGTSRTRSRVINEENEIIGCGIVPVGVRQTAISGSKSEITKGLKEAIRLSLDDAGIGINQISEAVASGLIVSDLGLLELEHVETPVDIDVLAKNSVLNNFPDILPVPIRFIPGVKNHVDDLSVEKINQADFMRAEETQTMGLITLSDKLDFSVPFNFLTLSSFTKIIYVNSKGEIQDAITNVTGQLFPAIMKETLLSGCLPKDFISCDQMDEEKILNGANYCEKVGFARALMLVRLMQYLLKKNPIECFNFFEGLIAQLDMDILLSFMNKNPGSLVITGDNFRSKTYKFLLQNKYNFAEEITILDNNDIDRATVLGAIAIKNQVKSL